MNGDSNKNVSLEPKLGLVQMQVTENISQNLAQAIDQIREAASFGANIILLPELFAHHYFCQIEDENYCQWAFPIENHPFLSQFQNLAKELGVVLPISFFEKSGQAYFNSIMVFDADGTPSSVYRKMHIPDGPGYQEKFYFNPGDQGYKVVSTRFGKIGIAICWDQWFPEVARILALKGANLLLFPTAIGSEPVQVDSPSDFDMWQKAMLGHAVCNSVYIGAVNRVGREDIASHICDFYGGSFIADYCGKVMTSAGNDPTILYATLSFSRAETFRAGMGFFRDRRPESYGALQTLDGNIPAVNT